MKFLFFLALFFFSINCFSQLENPIKTEGGITEITVHTGRKTRETALVKFKLEDGTEQIGSVELFRIPFIGSMKSVGDTITVNYNRNNPVLLQTTYGNFLSSYGMYILIVLGIIFSIKPFLDWKKSQQLNS
jgi:hypothetical protein